METVPSEETNERPSVPAVRVLSVKEISLLVVTPSLLASSVSAFPKVVFGAERSRVPFKAERVEWSATESDEPALRVRLPSEVFAVPLRWIVLASAATSLLA